MSSLCWYGRGTCLYLLLLISFKTHAFWIFTVLALLILLWPALLAGAAVTTIPPFPPSGRQMGQSTKSHYLCMDQFSEGLKWTTDNLPKDAEHVHAWAMFHKTRKVFQDFYIFLYMERKRKKDRPWWVFLVRRLFYAPYANASGYFFFHSNF